MDVGGAYKPRFLHEPRWVSASLVRETLQFEQGKCWLEYVFVVLTLL